MQLPRFQFTIRRMMIAVAIVAIATALAVLLMKRLSELAEV
jgi:hypothetical protein